MELHQAKQQIEILKNSLEEKSEETRRLSNKIIDTELKYNNLQSELETSLEEKSTVQTNSGEL